MLLLINLGKTFLIQYAAQVLLRNYPHAFR